MTQPNKRTVPVIALFLAASVRGLFAQTAPVQQAASWQRSDSIYKLAVDSTYKTDRSTVLLLDEGIVRMEPDGRASHTYHQIIQVLRQSVVEGMSERELSWAPDRQSMQVNWVKVLKLNGEVVSEGPSQSQDSDVPAALSNPVYGNTRVHRMSLSGLAPGTMLDISYTIQDTAAYPPRDQYQSWGISTNSDVKRSNLLISVPEGTKLSMVEKNLNFKRAERTENGRHIYQWATSNVPYVPSEMFAADSNTIDMSVNASLPRPWKDIGTWYAGLAKDRYLLGAPARAKIKTAVANAKTRDDSIRALHKLVAADVRYVSVSLGIGGYQPRMPDSVALSGFGDCKDKATFFVAALRDWGIKADPVLLNLGGRVEASLPSARQFDHAIAAIEVGTGYQFVDLTASDVPYGEVPGADQGEFVIVIRNDGRVDEVRIPIDSVGKSGMITRIVGELTPDGIFNGHYDETGRGEIASAMRPAFLEPLDSTNRANLTRSMANRVYQGSTGDSLVVFNGRDFAAPVHVGIAVHGAKAGSKSGSSMILNLNLGSLAGVSAIVDRLQSQGARKYPIDAEEILGTAAQDVEFRVTLPQGWKAQLPEPVTATGMFGDVRTEYSQVGRDLVIRRHTAGARGVYGPEKISDLIAWFKLIAQDDVKFVVLSTSGG